MNDYSAYSADPKKISQDFIDDSPFNSLNKNENINNFEIDQEEENLNLMSNLGMKIDNNGYELRKNLKFSKTDIRPKSIDFNYASVCFNILLFIDFFYLIIFIFVFVFVCLFYFIF
jgi:hypothetical protein